MELYRLNNKEYTIQDVSKLANISIRTLRFYDEIGLLKPIIRMQNGRRYYSEEQILKLWDIIFLKKIGFSLKKIVTILNLNNKDKKSLIEAKKKFLEKEIVKIKEQIKSIDTTLELYYKGENINYDEIIKQFELFQESSKKEKELFFKEFGNLEDDESNHPKYASLKWKITSKPVTDFLTVEFLELMRGLSDRGLISNKTMSDLIGRDYELEKINRDKELENGDDILMYPKPIQNQEDKGIDLREDYTELEEQGKITCECPKCGNKIPLPEGKHCKDIRCEKCNTPMRRLNRPGKGKEERNKDNPDKKVLDDRKPGSPEAQNFNQAKEMKLTGAPYTSVKELPSGIAKNMNIGLQRTFMRVFNKAYKKYKSDEKAFKIAWSVIKKIAKKNDKGKWVRKKGMKLSKSKFEEAKEEVIEEGDEFNV